jgi:hypothetical protein
VVDSGGVTRKIARLFAVDSGNVARLIYQAITYGLPTGNLEDIEGTPGIGAQSRIDFTSGGDVVWNTINNGSPVISNWVAPTSFAPGAYTLRADITSGSLDGGSAATGSDLALTSNRFWSRSRATGGGAGSTACALNLTLKNAGVTVATASVTLTATTIS